jgi:hypothetical protein
MRRVAILLPVAALLAGGCGRDGYQPARGRLTDPSGNPIPGLAGGSVVFEATADGRTVSASGAIDADGRFVLGTDGLADGAAVGTHRVLISPPDATGDIAAKKVIHPRYEAFDTSGLTAEVKPGANEFAFKLDPPPGRK